MSSERQKQILDKLASAERTLVEVDKKLPVQQITELKQSIKDMKDEYDILLGKMSEEIKMLGKITSEMRDHEARTSHENGELEDLQFIPEESIVHKKIKNVPRRKTIDDLSQNSQEVYLYDGSEILSSLK